MCKKSNKSVGPSFDGKSEQGETACHMCGKSYICTIYTYITSNKQNNHCFE